MSCGCCLEFFFSKTHTWCTHPVCIMWRAGHGLCNALALFVLCFVLCGGWSVFSLFPNLCNLPYFLLVCVDRGRNCNFSSFCTVCPLLSCLVWLFSASFSSRCPITWSASCSSVWCAQDRRAVPLLLSFFFFFLVLWGYFVCLLFTNTYSLLHFFLVSVL